MSGSRNGVTWYATGIVTVPVYFPEGDICCRWCPYVRYDDSLRRHRCLFTDEYIVSPMDSTGALCPVEFKEEEVKNELDR